MLVQIPSFQGHNLLVPAAFAIIVWILLIYVVFTHSGKGGHPAAPGPRRFYRAPSQFEKKWSRGPRGLDRQLYSVQAASFEKKRLLNFSEYPVFKIIEQDIAAARRGYRVFPQTSLGEVLSSSDDAAFYSINSKRVDMLIVDQGGWPVAAVEFQGGGHYQGTATVRDAVKKEALWKAGIHYVEIFPNDSAEQIRSRVRQELGWEVAASLSHKKRAV